MVPDMLERHTVGQIHPVTTAKIGDDLRSPFSKRLCGPSWRKIVV